MPYVAADDRYDAMHYRRCGRERPQAARHLARPLAQLRRRSRRSRSAARSCAARSTSASRTSTSPTTTARRTARRRRPSAACCARTCAPYRDELIISTKAGYDMWPGPYGEWGSRKYLLASLDQSLAPDGARLRRHLLLAPPRPGHAARGDDGRARQRRAAGQGAVRRDLLVLGRADARGRGDPAASSARRCLIHQPCYSMLNRWIEPELARRARRARRRLHRVLAARAGPAHRPLPGRHPGRLARRPRRLLCARARHRRDAREGAALNEIAAAARAVAGAARARLGAARPAHDLGADRREQRRPARGRTSARSTTSTSPTRSSRRSTATRPRATSTSGSVERALSPRTASVRPRPAVGVGLAAAKAQR